MTEVHSGSRCEHCDEHDGTHCQNMLSDHYGHALAEFHPACEHFVNVYGDES